MKKFGTVILGSGYFSLGYALNAENTLIIERTQLADPNFGGTLCGFEFVPSPKWTNETKDLHDYYVNKKIVSGQRLNSSVSEVGLCAYVEKKGVNLLLGTECTDVKKCENGHELTVINNGGFDRIFCKKLIDTRCSDDRRYLNVLCRGERLTADCGTPENFKLAVAGAFESEEYVAEFEFSAPRNVNFAKTEALRYLEKRFAESGAQIVQCAYVMHADTKLLTFENGEIPKVRELSLLDGFSAFDAGVGYALEGAI